MRSTEVLYRALLTLYPTGFRRELEETLLRDFRSGVEQKRSVATRTAFVLRELTDLMANLPGAWIDARADRARNMDDRMGRGSTMEGIGQDLRFALRSVRVRPSFAAVVVLTLALGIGSNAVVFGVVNGVLLKPLPYPNSGDLVYMYESYKGDQTRSVSYLNFQDWRARNRVFEDVAARTAWSFTLTGEGPAEVLNGLIISANLLPLLDVKPVVGRVFTDEEEQGEDHVVLLSGGLWARSFGSNPGIVGRTVTLNDEPWTVIGVVPSGVEFPLQADVYAPLTTLSDRDRNRRSSRPGISVIGRLRSGATLAAARRDMSRVAAALAAEYPDADAESGVVVRTLRERYLGSARPVLTPLVGACLLVFLIACANVANLFLVRGQTRRREAAVRTALGGAKGRVARTYLAEAGLLSGGGAVLGVLLAYGGIGVLRRLTATGVPRLARVQVDGTVLLFVVAASVVATLLVGVLPAVRLSSVEPARELGGSGSRGSTVAGGRVRAGLVVVEVALSFVLLVGSGLMVRSMANLGDTKLGFDPSNVLTVGLPIPAERYPTSAERARVFDLMASRVAALPGVTGVSGGDPLPMGGNSRQRTTVAAEPNAVGNDGLRTDWFAVTSGYFANMGMHFVEGGPWDDQVSPDAPSVVVDRTLAERYWPGQSALGRRIRFGSEHVWATVSGVVEHLNLYGPRVAGREEIFVPHSLSMWGENLVIRSRRDPGDLAREVRAAVAEVDPQVPLGQVATMESLVEGAVAAESLTTRTLGIFAAAALALAMLGLYGVVSYTVSLRSREIGIRMALGARSRWVLRRVAGRGVGLALTGVAVGLAAAAGATRLLAALLFNVEPMDGVTLTAVAVALLMVSALAAFVPAVRASRVDPVKVLNTE